MRLALHRQTKQIARGVSAAKCPLADWVHDPDLGAVAGLPNRYWRIQPDDSVAPMTQDERDAADAAALPGFRAERMRALAVETTAYIQSHYSEPAQRSFLALIEDARNRVPPLVNRAAYCQSMIDWAKTVLDQYAGKSAEIGGATTWAAVEAVTWSFAAFDATDPLRTVAGAMAIND
jgi:hypothetical protein